MCVCEKQRKSICGKFYVLIDSVKSLKRKFSYFSLHTFVKHGMRGMGHMSLRDDILNTKFILSHGSSWTTLFNKIKKKIGNVSVPKINQLHTRHVFGKVILPRQLIKGFSLSVRFQSYFWPGNCLFNYLIIRKGRSKNGLTDRLLFKLLATFSINIKSLY